MNRRTTTIGLAAIIVALAALVAFLASPSDPDLTKTEVAPEPESAEASDDQQPRPDRPTAIGPRPADPASDQDWILPEVDRELVVEMLQSPASDLDLCDTVAWTPFKGWISVPDAGGPWSLARRDCAREKLGHDYADACSWKVNLVIRRTPTGEGEIVAAAAGFDLSEIADEPGAQGFVDTSLESARCKAFARCMATRGFANSKPPLPPGPAGEMFSVEVPGRELPRATDKAKAREGLEGAIRFTREQIAALEADPRPDDVDWHFHLAMYRRALEYYEWLLTQV